jgi:hypothetical protein
MWWIYLLAGTEVVALGNNALVVVNVVLPAVLGPSERLITGSLGTAEDSTYWFW